MSNWVLVVNSSYFDIDSLVEDRGYVDWQKRKNHFSIGDTVFFYLSSPQKRIKYKGTIVRTGLKETDIGPDSKYWKNRDEYTRGEGSWIRVRIDSRAKNDSLTIDNLRRNGFSASVQGPSKISDEIARYIDGFMSPVGFHYPDSEGLDEVLTEGAVKTVIVNAYERNPDARQKCIDHYGTKCRICEIDFGIRYGEFAAGFIHVHHLVPLHEIGDEYIVDSIRDLIPVCPNCHAMLHRKREDGGYYSPEELKLLINGKKIMT